MQTSQWQPGSTAPFQYQFEYINTNVNSFRGTEKEENESFLPPKTTAQRASHGHH
jgi:hypothetical protein